MGKVALAVLIFVALLCLSGCGGTDDPYIGTWKRVDKQGSTSLVIAETDAGYQLAFVGTAPVVGWTPMSRRGEKLIGWPDAMLPGKVKVILVYDTASKRLLLSSNSLQGVPYVKVSDSTSTPSPSD
jgi:hypothetical protein